MTSSSAAATTYYKKDDNKTDQQTTAEDVHRKTSLELNAKEQEGQDVLMKLYEGKENMEYKDNIGKNNGKELPATPAELPEGFGSLLYEQFSKRPRDFVPIRRGLIPPSHKDFMVRDNVNKHLAMDFGRDNDKSMNSRAGKQSQHC